MDDLKEGLYNSLRPRKPEHQQAFDWIKKHFSPIGEDCLSCEQFNQLNSTEKTCDIIEFPLLSIVNNCPSLPEELKPEEVLSELYAELYKAADGFLKKKTKISILRAAVKAIKAEREK